MARPFVKMKWILLLLIVSTSATAFLEQQGDIQARTRIDSLGFNATQGNLSGRPTGGEFHPVTNYSVSGITGFIGAFDLTGTGIGAGGGAVAAGPFVPVVGGGGNRYVELVAPEEQQVETAIVQQRPQPPQIEQPAQAEPIIIEQLAPPPPPATPVMIVQEPKKTSWITKTAFTAALLAVLVFILERRPRKPKEAQLVRRMDDTWEYTP